MNYKKRPF